jgi:hypothetical protein
MSVGELPTVIVLVTKLVVVLITFITFDALQVKYNFEPSGLIAIPNREFVPVTFKIVVSTAGVAIEVLITETDPAP